MSTPDRDGLSVFFPVHNEAESIGPVVERALEALPAVAARHEVIVVDDGSDDATPDAVAALIRRHGERVRVVRHPRNRGYGAALRTGFEAARLPWVFFSDGDGQFDLGEISEFIEPIRSGRARVVVGYRRVRRDPLPRRINAWMWGALVRVVLGVRVRDVNCAFKILPTDLVRSLALESEGATVSAELLAKLAGAGIAIEERPVTHLPRTKGSASGGSPRVIAGALVELIRVRAGVRRFRGRALAGDSA